MAPPKLEETGTPVPTAQLKPATEVDNEFEALLDQEIERQVSGEAELELELDLESIAIPVSDPLGPISAEGIPLLENPVGFDAPEQTDVRLTPRRDLSFGRMAAIDTNNNVLAARQGHHPFVEDLTLAPDEVIRAAREGSTPGAIKNPDPEKYVAFYDSDGQIQLYHRNPEYDDILMMNRIAYLFGDAAVTEAIRFGGKGVSVVTARATQQANDQMTDAGKAAEAARLQRTADPLDPASYRSRLDRNIARFTRDSTRKWMMTGPDVRAQAVEQELRNYLKTADKRQLLTKSDIEIIVNNARAVAKEGVATLPKGGADQLLSMLDASARASERGTSEVVRDALQKLPTMLWDRSWNVKREIAKKLGTARGTPGERTLTSFLNVWGAPAAARVKFFDGKRQVYRGLNNTQRTLLDEVIMLRRMQTITSYKDTHRLGNVTFNIESTQQALDKLATKHGTDVIVDMEKRANAYFNTMREQVTQMRNAGLITDDELVKLTRLDYAPLELIEAVDPTIEIFVGGRRGKSTVKSSGIEALGRGGKELIETDSEFLLNQFLMRTEARMARNRANKELYRAGLAEPGNGVVFIKKPKGEQTSEFSVMIDGERKKFYLPTWLADEWSVSAGSAIPRWVSEMFAMASLAKVVRPLATGSNPYFAVRNFPREMHGAWMKTDVYSTFFPVARAQQWKDVGEVFTDVMKPDYGPLTRQFFEEGGATQFLAQQGHIHTFVENPLLRKHLRHPGVQRALFAAEYVSERAELLVRVSTFNRALKNGIRPEEAARISREIIDFDQGGLLTKTLDSFVPYLNASVQGIRSMASAAGVGLGPTRTAAKRLQQFSWKLTQYTGVVGMWNIMNRQINEEGWRQVPDDVKMNNLVLMTPFSYEDENGEPRYLYFRIPTEQTMRPFIAFANAMQDWYFDGREPSDMVRQTIAGGKEALAIIPGGNSVPLWAAMNTYASNRDAWNNVPVWTGPEVLPEAEVYQRPSRQTSQLAQDISGVVSPTVRALSQDPNVDAIGMSPARTEAAARKIFPRNPIIDIPTAIYEHIRRPGDLPEALDRKPLERLRDVPFVGSMIGFTNPISPFMSKTTFYRRTGNTRRFELATELDNIIASGQVLGRDTFNDAKRYANTLGQEKPWALRRLNARRIIDKRVGKGNFELPGMPPKVWWLNIRDVKPEERAKLIGEVYHMSEDQTKRAIQRMTRLVPGIYDQQGVFNHHWNRERRRVGAEQ